MAHMPMVSYPWSSLMGASMYVCVFAVVEKLLVGFVNHFYYLLLMLQSKSCVSLSYTLQYSFYGIIVGSRDNKV